VRVGARGQRIIKSRETQTQTPQNPAPPRNGLGLVIDPRGGQWDPPVTAVVAASRCPRCRQCVSGFGVAGLVRDGSLLVRRCVGAAPYRRDLHPPPLFIGPCCLLGRGRGHPCLMLVGTMWCLRFLPCLCRDMGCGRCTLCRPCCQSGGLGAVALVKPLPVCRLSCLARHPSQSEARQLVDDPTLPSGWFAARDGPDGEVRG
jgi:hypothetical protein